jgi:CrcB protein
LALRNIFAVSIGGIIGSLLRWLISLTANENGRPGGTLVVNFVGSGILLWAFYYFKAHPSIRWWWRPAISSGFCGGFTTYSAFAVQMQGYLEKHQYGPALLYISVSLIGTTIVMALVSKKFAR